MDKKLSAKPPDPYLPRDLRGPSFGKFWICYWLGIRDQCSNKRRVSSKLGAFIRSFMVDSVCTVLRSLNAAAAPFMVTDLSIVQ